MDFTALLDTLAFLAVHVTVFELPLVILATALAAYVLARTLDRHNARMREARLARRIAVFYAFLLAALMTARALLM